MIATSADINENDRISIPAVFANSIRAKATEKASSRQRSVDHVKNAQYEIAATTLR